jgi:PAP_fibrillin
VGALGGVTSSPSMDALTSTTTTGADNNDKNNNAKTNLLETARSLNEEFGCLILDSNAQDRLREAVEQLESSSGGDSPIPSSSGLIGTWTLLCSTASASLQSPLDRTVGGIDTSKLPFFNQGPIKTVRDTFNKALTVQQVIKEDELTPGLINRIDHVLQYSPPNTLSAFLDNDNNNDESAADTPSSRIPDAIKNLNINPLQVTNSKVVLVHKAEVQQVTPVLKTKLTLSSIIGTLSPW